jgi:hypothetical protein
MSEFTEALRSHTRLQDRADYSRNLLEKIRADLLKRPSCNRPELCIYAAGSLARHETGRVSDLDLFFIGHRPERKSGQRSISRLEELQAFADLINLNERLELAPFSGDGQYLKIHELDDIISGTGSVEDDSENLFTTRLLLLLESTAIAGEGVYNCALDKVLEMYFRDTVGRKGFRPLFLLNDLLRYWRTLCLNYERDRFVQGKPWWKRNLNLKFSRKLTVFSSVLAIVSNQIETAKDFKPFVLMTPMQRLAAALDHLADLSLFQEFRAVLDDYEDFLSAKSHKELEGDQRPPPLEEFSEKAQRFDDFLHQAFSSAKLDRALVRYVLI